MKIAVDIFGGDNAPIEIVKGCVDALKANPKLSIVAFGKEDIVRAEFAKHTFDAARLEIVNATEVIENDDSPTEAIKTKKDSSLVKALKRAKTDPEVGGVVSAGATGAVLTGGFFLVGRIRGVLRPALAPLMPTAIESKRVLLIDCGANVDSKPEFLVQFAQMGVSFMKAMRGIENPRVGLLSVGAEDTKGNELTKAVFPMLKELPINFAGNVEARDVLTGEYDVIVADGFAGNICMKAMEGASTLIMDIMKQSIMERAMSKLGYLFMKPSLRKMKNRMDYTKIGGSPFLGLEKIVVKAHGSSKAVSIAAAINQAYELADADLINRFKADLKLNEEE